MGRIIKSSILLILLLIGCFYLLIENNIIPEKGLSNISQSLKEKEIYQGGKDPAVKQSNETLGEDILHWIDKPADDLLQALGEPERKDLSAYGYTWWVYTDQKDEYIQFGIKNNKINTIYTTGNNVSVGSTQIGQSYETLNDQLSFSEEVDYSEGITYFNVILTKEDLEERPLVKVKDDIFVQYYFDTVTDKLSSIRILTADVLLKHASYEMKYRGKLPSSPDLTDEEWDEVESGMEKQIFDITNIMRSHYERSELKWDDSAHEVAFTHSKDMADNNYFSHYSLDGDGLKERLSVKDLSYVVAGENIAAQYEDAPATVIGWLNSEGHREALLKNEYTHLGVGVYRLYYTQNFLAKP